MAIDSVKFETDSDKPLRHTYTDISAQPMKLTSPMSSTLKVNISQRNIPS
jgi:hypothetical protein